MKKFLLSIVILIAGLSASFATHNRAGEITYQWISGYTYKFTVTTYTNTFNTTADRCEVTVYFGDGDSAVALGGVAHKPWRVEAADAALPRGPKEAASALLAGARTTPANAYKIPLVERTLGAVLAEARR